MDDIFETCEDCYNQVSIMKMIVKETPDGNCIYCSKCVEHHKYLEKEADKLIKQWGLDVSLRDEPKQFKKKSKSIKETNN
jgi:hypothetical protein